MTRFTQWLSLITLLTTPLYAGTIVSVVSNDEQVTVSNDFNGRKLEVNDKICIFDNNETELACGIAAEFNTKTILLKVEQKKAPLVVRTKIKERRYLKIPIFTKEKTITNNANSNRTVRKTIITKRTEVDKKKVDLGLGMEFGFPLYYYPYVHLQWAPFEQFSLGIEPLFIPNYTNNSNISITALGAFGTLNYYFSKYAFKGFFLQAAVGIYKLKLEATSPAASEEYSPIAGKGMIGWRGTIIPSLGIDAGLAVGGQYVQDLTQNSAFIIDFKSLMPVFGGFVSWSIF